MQKLIKFHFFLWVILVCACKKDNAGNVLIGRWQLAESYVGTGSGNTDKWKPVDSKTSLYLQFKSNGTLGGNSYYPSYTSYVIKDNKIVTFYKPSGTYEDFAYTVSTNSLTLSPAGPAVCIEGCASRYVNADYLLRQLLP